MFLMVSFGSSCAIPSLMYLSFSFILTINRDSFSYILLSVFWSMFLKCNKHVVPYRVASLRFVSLLYIYIFSFTFLQLHHNLIFAVAQKPKNFSCSIWMESDGKERNVNVPGLLNRLKQWDASCAYLRLVMIRNYMWYVFGTIPNISIEWLTIWIGVAMFVDKIFATDNQLHFTLHPHTLIF